MPNGIIVIDKAQGWTSMDVCAKLRGIFREKRVGHSGTLDPMATGVLPVFLGRATRAVAYATESEKEYVAGIKLGVITDTQDTTGTVLETRPCAVSPSELEAVLDRFRGDIAQIPPMYSAIKIDGKKLYELARKGREVERKPRPITLYGLTVEGQLGADEFLLRVRCSKGTYIRTLCHDVGQALGCGGAMSSLRRTMTGGFTLDDAVTLDQVVQAAETGGAEALLSGVDRCFPQTPKLTVGAGERDRFIKNGAAFPWAGPEGLCRVYGPEGEFLMLGRIEAGLLRTEKSFFDVCAQENHKGDRNL